MFLPPAASSAVPPRGQQSKPKQGLPNQSRPRTPPAPPAAPPPRRQAPRPTGGFIPSRGLMNTNQLQATALAPR